MRLRTYLDTSGTNARHEEEEEERQNGMVCGVTNGGLRLNCRPSYSGSTAVVEPGGTPGAPRY